jgi:probable HAF family extracellular repeat protein
MSLEKILNKINTIKERAKQTFKGLAYSGIIGLASLGFLTGNAKAENLRYETTKLNIPAHYMNYLEGINDYGEIVGGFFCLKCGGLRAFLYKNNEILELNEDFGLGGAAVAINDFGEILVKDGNNRSFVYKLGKRIELDFLAEDINNRGDVVGENYLYMEDPYPVKIELPFHIRAFAINDRRQIAGVIDDPLPNHRPVLLDDNMITELERVPGGPEEDPNYYEYYIYDINNDGKIVGWFGIQKSPRPGPAYACMWDENGKIKQLDIVSSRSKAIAINDKGHIVGWRLDPNNPAEAMAFLYKNENIIDLNNFFTALSKKTTFSLAL